MSADPRPASGRHGLVRLSLACGDYDRVRALRERRVRPEGLDLVFLPLMPEEIFFRQAVHHEFDVSELSLATYTSLRSRGDTSFIAIPVFPSRAFRHSGIFVRSDAGIAKPQDLRGKRVGLSEYQLTANVWIRGILEDEHGVRPSEIEWLTGGLEEAGRREKIELPLPPDIRVRPIPDGKTLSAMLESGELDAVIGPRIPSAFRRGAPGVRRLFPDYRTVEIDYFRRTSIFPIMHTVAIKREVYERDRWIAQSLAKAFAQAKRLVEDTIYETAASWTMIPWMHEEVEIVRSIAGADWWPYGIDPNRTTLETFMRYAVPQGVAARGLAVEELFAPETLDTVKI